LGVRFFDRLDNIIPYSQAVYHRIFMSMLVSRSKQVAVFDQPNKCLLFIIVFWRAFRSLADYDTHIAINCFPNPSKTGNRVLYRFNLPF
jgi:hypothetical protein